MRRLIYPVMHPTIELFFFELPAYTALVMLGVAVGLLIANLALRAIYRRAAQPSTFLNLALVVLIAGWIGARAYHAATHWDYYSARPAEIAQVGLGGLAMRGGLIAGWLALIAYARVRNLHFTQLADAAAIGLSAGQALGWVGALAHGTNYGVVSESQFAIDLPDIYGLAAPRFPVQHAEIGLFVCLLVSLLLLAWRQPNAGILFSVYLGISSTANFLIGFQRGDDGFLIGGWRTDQWIDLALLVTALLFYWLTCRGGNVGINQ